MTSLEPRPNEPRASFLLRVAALFIREHAPSEEVHYDEKYVEGLDLAGDCEREAETIRHETLEDASLDIPEPPTKPTTIEGWLRTLPPDEAERALRNCSPSEEEEPCESTDGALFQAFSWATSPEGIDYWHAIYRREEAKSRLDTPSAP